METHCHKRSTKAPHRSRAFTLASLGKSLRLGRSEAPATRRAFTLVELLVVILIIAALMLYRAS